MNVSSYSKYKQTNEKQKQTKLTNTKWTRQSQDTDFGKTGLDFSANTSKEFKTIHRAVALTYNLMSSIYPYPRVWWVRRRQADFFTLKKKNRNSIFIIILGFSVKKCIQMGADKPSFGSVVLEIAR